MFYELLKKRQLWLALLALVQSLVLNYLAIPAFIWQEFNLFCGILILTFTIEEGVAHYKGVAYPVNAWWKSRKMWLAFVAMAFRIGGYYLPGINPDILASFRTIIIILITAVTFDDTLIKAGWGEK